MSATTFVTTSFLGAATPPRPWESSGMPANGMTTEQLKEVAAQGMEIGSHGRHHFPFPRLSQAALNEECCESRSVLEEIIDGPVHEFAYPHGLYDGRVVSAVEAAGYQHAWACDPFPLHAGVRPYCLPRISVSECTRTREDFLRLLWGDDLRGRLNLRFGGRRRALNSIPLAGADTNVRPS
jgi:peptidoglycan/xylan/chitin deacetylase (PgdA/CDA1 family)